MKYLIKYTSGNGYSCNCCSNFRDETTECYSEEEALKEVAAMLAYYRPGYDCYKEAVPIPESPDDFILNECDEYVVKFDSDEFNNKAKVLAAKLKKEEQEQAEEDERKRTVLKEKQEKAEYERLKVKYGA